MPQLINDNPPEELAPKHFPELACALMGVFGPNQNLRRGTIVAPRADGMLYPREANGAAHGVLKVDLRIDARGNHFWGRHHNQTAPGAGVIRSTLFQSAPVYISGVFNPSDLIGLDHAAVRALNGRILFDGSFRF
jgi:hypothetical protein